MLALLALGGCAAMRGRSDTPNGQECRAAAYPAHLPAATQVLDTAAIMRALRDDASWQNATSSAVLSITYAQTGEPAFPQVLATTLPPLGKRAPAEALVQTVRGALRNAPVADSAWGLRIHVSGAPPRFELEPQLVCLARPVSRMMSNGYVMANRSARTITIADRPMPVSLEERAPLGPRPIALRVLVDRDGSVSQVEVSATGDLPDFEARRVIEQAAPGMRFYPALRDGSPEPAWVRLWAWIH